MEGRDGLHLHQLHKVEEEGEEETVADEEVEKVADGEKNQEDLVKVKGQGEWKKSK